MTPHQKAIELVRKFEGLVAKPFDGNGNIALKEEVKQRAVICCNEVIQALAFTSTSVEPYKYWQDVRKEICKL